MLEPGLAGVPAHGEMCSIPADVRRIHDLVGCALLEHAVLVDAGLVRERIRSDDRLVDLHANTGDGGNQPAYWYEALGVDLGEGASVVLAARGKRHHDFFERGVASPLTDPVHGDFN